MDVSLYDANIKSHALLQVWPQFITSKKQANKKNP